MGISRFFEALSVLMFSFASKRLLVRAFSSSARGVARTAAVRPVVFPYTRTFASQVEASVEEDLDAALDDILGDTFDETESSNGVAEQAANGNVEPGTHIEGSKPIPKTLVEKVSSVACICQCDYSRNHQHCISLSSCSFLHNHRTIRLTLTTPISCLLPTLVGLKLVYHRALLMYSAKRVLYVLHRSRPKPLGPSWHDAM